LSILKIARIGHPVLRQVAAPVSPEALASDELQRLIRDMLETVEAADGAGLAAPQVHESVRVVVLQVDRSRGMEVWINPELTPTSDELIGSYEGCLSVPGLRGLVARPAGVRVSALAPDGSPIALELQGFPAIVAQHECDHLDGVVYIDKVEPKTLGFIEELRRFPPAAGDDEGDGEDDEDQGEDTEDGEALGDDEDLVVEEIILEDTAEA
jgi:peptide deformylase